MLPILLKRARIEWLLQDAEKGKGKHLSTGWNHFNMRNLRSELVHHGSTDIDKTPE